MNINSVFRQRTNPLEELRFRFLFWIFDRLSHEKENFSGYIDGVQGNFSGFEKLSATTMLFKKFALNKPSDLINFIDKSTECDFCTSASLHLVINTQFVHCLSKQTEKQYFDAHPRESEFVCV